MLIWTWISSNSIFGLPVEKRVTNQSNRVNKTVRKVFALWRDKQHIYNVWESTPAGALIRCISACPVPGRKHDLGD